MRTPTGGRLEAVGLLILGTFAVPCMAFADGALFAKSPDGWDLVDETHQLAYINHEDGVEKLIVAVGIQELDQRAVWILPVPGDPRSIAIDVLSELPFLHGRDIRRTAKAVVREAKEVSQLTQIYIFPFFLKGLTLGDAMPAVDVLVRKRIEKEGVTAEVISAGTGQALYQYLGDKELVFPSEFIPILDHYVGEEFTFVVSWLSKPINTPQKKARPKGNIQVATKPKQKGLYIAFPTEEIYYPLLPTSVYGEREIPIDIRVIGFVTPTPLRGLQEQIETHYYLARYIVDAPGTGSFYDAPKGEVRYTRIRIKAVSNMLKQDLHISKQFPRKILYSLYVATHSLVVTLVFVAVCSVLSSVAMGMLVFREARTWKGLFKFGLVGLCNLATIIGVMITVALVRTRPIAEDDKPLVRELRQRGYATWAIRKRDLRKVFFVLMFSICLLEVSWIVAKVLEFTL